MKEIQPPNFIPNNLALIFLAGSIEMGSAERWQDKALALLSTSRYTVLNPRRADWDSSWEQTIDNPKFFEQVNWELQGLEEAEKVIIYFDINSKSPITLLELGLMAGRDPEKLLVVCPPGFWRKGNVDVVCDRYRIKKYDSLEKAIGNLMGL